MFVFISPSVSLYQIFASPAVSSLTLKIVISVLPIAPVFLMLRVSQHVIEPGPRLSPRINRRMRCSGESSWKIFWSSFSSRVTTYLSDSSWTCCRNAVGVPRPCGLALSARAFHRATCLATLATEHPASAFKPRRPFELSFSSICLFKSVLLGAVSSEP